MFHVRRDVVGITGLEPLRHSTDAYFEYPGLYVRDLGMWMMVQGTHSPLPKFYTYHHQLRVVAYDLATDERIQRLPGDGGILNKRIR